MPVTRRTFVKAAVAALAAHQKILPRLSAKPRAQTILVLGGTNFLGPAIVKRALRAGHRVTLFNRGKTNPSLFPTLEKIRGDRETNAEEGLSALSGNRHWDAVIDVWPSEPAVVMPAARLLADRTDFYSFVSSIGAYADTSRSGTVESAPLLINESGSEAIRRGLKLDLNRSSERSSVLSVPALSLAPVTTAFPFTTG